jgi:hypothetical protein
MALTTVEKPDAALNPSVVERVVDAARVATHVAHEARLLKTVAEDTIEDGVYAAKRAVKAVGRRVDDLGDLKDDAVRRVKRKPLLAVGAAFALGLAFGVVAGWIGSRRHRQDDAPE